MLSLLMILSGACTRVIVVEKNKRPPGHAKKHHGHKSAKQHASGHKKKKPSGKTPVDNRFRAPR